MNLNENQYRRLVAYAGTVSRDHSRKKDYVHDAWIKMIKYCKNIPKDPEDMLLLLMSNIKQVIYTKSWADQHIFYYENVPNINMDFQPLMELPSRAELLAMRKSITVKSYKHTAQEYRNFRQPLATLRTKDYEAESVERGRNIRKSALGD